MRKIAPLFITLLFWGVCFSHSYPHSNRPELIRPILDRFVLEAEARGLDGEKLLGEIDSIIVIKKPLHKGQLSDGIQWTRGSTKWIELREASFFEDWGDPFRLLFHEIGHALGLEDCDLCRYSFMRHQTSQRANYLFRDDDLAAAYLDIYFEAIKDPEKYNKSHKHR